MYRFNNNTKVIGFVVVFLLGVRSAYALYLTWKSKEEKERIHNDELETKLQEKEKDNLLLQRQQEETERKAREEQVANEKELHEKNELISQLKVKKEELSKEIQQLSQKLTFAENRSLKLKEAGEVSQTETAKLQDKITELKRRLKEREEQYKQTSSKLKGIKEEKLIKDKQVFLCLANKPKPLTNLGNTCFMDAMLQNLAWCPKLGLELQTHILEQKMADVRNMEMTQSLYKLLCYTHDQTYNDNHGQSRSVPSDILQAARNRNDDFQGFQQQDSFEMFNTIIEGLREETVLDEENTTSSGLDETYEEKMMRKCRPARLFFGMFVTVYYYNSCEHVESVYQEFSSLTVPIMKRPPQDKTSGHVQNCKTKGEGKKNKKKKGKKSQRAGSSPINDKLFSDKEDERDGKTSQDTDQSEDDEFYDALDYVVKPDTVDGGKSSLISNPQASGKEKAFETLSFLDDFSTDLEYGLSHGLMAVEEFSEDIMSCRKCKSPAKTGKCYKKTLLCDNPSILVIHLDRFKENHRGSLEKRNDNVSYPDVLDIAPFCSSAMKILPQNSLSDTAYKLFGVVAHSGTINSGHYVAYIKTTNRSSAEWYMDMVGKPWVSPKRRKKDIEEYLEDRDIEKEEFTTTVPSKWFYISDDSVIECASEKEATQNRNAYVLMYEKAT